MKTSYYTEKKCLYSCVFVFMDIHRSSNVNISNYLWLLWSCIFKFSLCFSIYLSFPAVSIAVLYLIKNKKRRSLHLRYKYQQTIMILVLPGLVSHLGQKYKKKITAKLPLLFMTTQLTCKVIDIMLFSL